MEFGILGPLKVCRQGREIEIAAGKHRSLLAALLLRPNRTVPVADLITHLWGDAPPHDARATTQTYIGRLRRLLGDGLIQTRSDGYLIVVSQHQLDASRFDGLVQYADACEDPRAARASLTEALALWRGPALADVPSGSLHLSEVPVLTERRMRAFERRIDLDLAAGRAGDLVGELRALTAEHPLRERFWIQLITALDRCGRRGEALRAYGEIRTHLADELGVDPGPELRDLHLAILRDGPAAQPSSGGDSRLRTAPAQLPPEVAGFTGRDRELDLLDTLRARTSGDRDATVVAVVFGMAGVGKTALAVRWGRRSRDRFPDGQLHVNLRGHSPCPPLPPLDALALILEGLGVPPGDIPTQIDAATALYRSVVARRRLLVVLDDAADPDQVRPLLPAGADCMALVTSRNRLDGLIARDGARPVFLDTLTPGESADLLVAVLGGERVAAEPRAAATLAELSGRLPLAMRIAAANLLALPETAVSSYNALIRSGGANAFAVPGDEQSCVRTAFDLSYERQAPGDRRLFRLVSLVPGPDVTAHAAAALAGVEVESAREALTRLTSAHLIGHRAAGHYGQHDLLRQYAVELTGREDDPAARAAARRRLYRHYLDWADAAADLLYPQVVRLPRTRERVGPDAEFDDARAAVTWLDTERVNMVAAVARGAKHGPYTETWQLADTLRGYLWQRRFVTDWPAVAAGGLTAAEADGDGRAQAAARLSLGDLDLVLAQYPSAADHYALAAVLARDSGWLDGQGAAHGQLGLVHRSTSRPHLAAEQHLSALALYRRSGRQHGEAVCLGNLGVVYEELGLFEPAAEYTGQALDLFRLLGSAAGEANAQGNLGKLERLLGRLDIAEAHLTDALAQHRAAGQRSSEATALDELAALAHDRGQLDRARELATAALELATEIDDQFTALSALNTGARVQLHAGQPELAADLHRRAHELARKTGVRSLEADALIGLACVERKTGRLGDALASVYQALNLAKHTHNLMAQGNAEVVLAQIHRDGARHEQARRHALEALAVHARTGYQLGQLRARRVLAAVSGRSGAES